MTRILAVSLLTALAACSNAPVVHGPFVFRYLVPAETTIDEALSASIISRCKRHDPVAICEFTKNSIGETPTVGSSVQFYKGLFDAFEIYFEPGRREDVREIIDEVYGDDCGEGQEIIEPGTPRAIESNYIEWCFANGRLRLTDRFSVRDESKLRFSFVTPEAHETEPADQSDAALNPHTL